MATRGWALAACAALGLTAAAGRADDATKARDVKFDQHNGYFESNKSGLKDKPESFLAFTDRAGFSKVFGVGFVMGKRPNVVPRGAFKTRLVVAVIKRGDAIWTYKVEKVTARGDALIVSYKAEPKGGGGSARYASPLILSVDKGDYKTVTFVENGKKAGTAKVGK